MINFKKGDDLKIVDPASRLIPILEMKGWEAERPKPKPKKKKDSK